MRQVENPMALLPEIQRTIEAERTKAKKAKLAFVSVDEATLVAKLLRANSPIINWMSWNASLPQGGTLPFSVGVFNPDPVTRDSLFVWAFLGPGDMVVDPVRALLTTDTRFPRHQQPANSSGLSLSANGSSSVSFQIKIPTIDPGGYAIHGFLYQFNFFD